MDHSGCVMATRDSGEIGLPWVVRCARAGRGLRVSRYAPGDDLDAEGEVLGDLVGNPREMGRQLRAMLAGADLDLEN